MPYLSNVGGDVHDQRRGLLNGMEVGDVHQEGDESVEEHEEDVSWGRART